MTWQLLLVGLGGAIGSIIRYLLQRWLNPAPKSSEALTNPRLSIPGPETISYFSALPLGTLLVNIIGCLLIGMLWSWSARIENSDTVRLFGMTGLMGGFTTFSAFSLESVQLLRHDRPGLFLIYIGSSILLCLLATFIGIKLIRI